MSNVIVLPGLFGSTLSWNGLPIWPAGETGIAISTLLGFLDLLACNPDGSSTFNVQVGAPLSLYQPLIDALGATALAYDWRFTPSQNAAALAAHITAPTWIVAHSYGGAHARALVGLLQGQGRGGLIEGVVFLGSPMSRLLGTWSGAQSLAGLGEFFDQMVALSGLLGTFSLFDLLNGNLSSAALTNFVDALTGLTISPTNRLKRLLASWPSVSYLMPVLPGLRNAGVWAGINDHVTQAWLDGGTAARNADGNIVLSDWWNIYGTGFATPNGIALNATTLVGDQTVQNLERLPDVPGTPCNQYVTVNAHHMGLVASAGVISVLQALVSGAPVTSARATRRAVVCTDQHHYAIVDTAPPPPRPNVMTPGGASAGGGAFADP